jgi:hypothetical protein
MISAPTEMREIINLSQHRRNEEKHRTGWDFELWPKRNGLVDLYYAIRGNIIQEPLKMEHENGWKHLDENLLARFAEAARRTGELNMLQVRDACECVFYSVHRIVLLECFGVSR